MMNMMSLPSRAPSAERPASMPPPVAWDPHATPWSKSLCIDASTYSVRRFFGVTPTRARGALAIEAEGSGALSSDGAWLYCERLLPRYAPLDIYQGRKRGMVRWTEEVALPCLYYNARRDTGAEFYRPDLSRGETAPRWGDLPFMSLTPMEMFSLRAGTRLAKGTVVIAGLGLGHQLIETSLRKAVKDIILVERSQSLVDFIYPEVQKHLGPVPVRVIVGDAWKVLPTLMADVALVDIFPGYGGNTFTARCPDIGHIWCWGGCG